MDNEKNILKIAEKLLKKDKAHLKTEKCLYCLDYITKKECLENRGFCKYCDNLTRS